MLVSTKWPGTTLYCRTIHKLSEDLGPHGYQAEKVMNRDCVLFVCVRERERERGKQMVSD